MSGLIEVRIADIERAAVEHAETKQRLSEVLAGFRLALGCWHETPWQGVQAESVEDWVNRAKEFGVTPAMAQARKGGTS